MIVLADPGDPRAGFLREALRRAARVTPLFTAYPELIEQLLHRTWRVPDGAVLRIDSPGRSPEAQAAILNHGHTAAVAGGWPVTPPSETLHASARRGLIVNPRQWHLGLARVLASVSASLEGRSDVLLTADPSAVALMFDKTATHMLLQGAGVPVPKFVGNPASYGELLALMERAGCSRVFAKLRFGSAASGVVALERSRLGVQAWTTVELIEESGEVLLFNSRRIARERDEHRVARILDALCGHGVHVERWVPKAGFDGRCFDIRMLVVAGEPAHGLARLSRTPITNLHLLNDRAPIERVVETIPPDTWRAVLATCRRVAALFDKNLQVSLDLALSPCKRRHWVLEVNAFGDLLRGCLCQGMDPFELQVNVLFGSGVDE